MTQRAHLYGQDSAGNWVPIRVDATGSMGGGGQKRYSPWTYAAAAGGITNTSDVTLRAAPGAGNAVYLSALQIVNKSATATEVIIKSGSDVLWRGFAAANGVSPISVEFDDPLYAAPNTALTAACVTTGTATLINAQGYTDISFTALQAQVTPQEEIYASDGTLLTTASGEPIYLH